MKKKIILLITIMLLVSVSSFSQELSSQEGLAVLKELSEKYNGSQIVELQVGITLKADAVASENGFLLIAFTGAAKDGNYENAVWIPLNEVKSINNEPVDQFYANVVLCNYYISQEGNASKAEIYFQNAQKIFKKNGSPEKYKKVIEDLSANLEILKNKTPNH